MRVTEVRIKLVDERTDQANERLRAFCSITLDDAFVVRDLRIIEGAKGLFVAMPSRKLTERCPSCRHKNPLTARYCNNCGVQLPQRPLPTDDQGRLRLHTDVAHPINQKCRDMIQRAVVQAFYRELQKAKRPGYRSRYEEDYASPQTSRPPLDPEHTGVSETPDLPQDQGAS